MADDGRLTWCLTAADRGSVGDVLTSRLVATIAGGADRAIVVGARTVDQRACGGTTVLSPRDAWARTPPDGRRIVHVGGDVLGVSTTDALTPAPGEIGHALREIRAGDAELAAAISGQLTGNPGPAGYVLATDATETDAEFHGAAFHGSGPPSLAVIGREHVQFLARELGRARHVGMRDEEALRWAEAHGIAAVAEPSVLTAIARVADAPIEASARHVAIRENVAEGWIVVELDAATIHAAGVALLSDELRALAARAGRRVVLSTPSIGRHGERARLRRLASAAGPSVVVLESDDVMARAWVVKHSDGYVGVGLTGRIVAAAYGVPRRSVVWAPAQRRAALERYVAMWDDLPGSFVATPSETAASAMRMFEDRDTDLRDVAASALATLEATWPAVDRARTTTSGRDLPDEGRSARSDDGAEANALAVLLAHRVAATSPVRARLDLAAPPTTHAPDDGTLRLFDAEWYVRQNPDLRGSSIPPDEHYVRFGWREGRDPHPLFDVAGYLARNPDLNHEVEPLGHYVRHGWREGRHPSDWFDPTWYLVRHPTVRDAGVEPLTHYLTTGWRQGLDPSATFDSDWYRRAFPEDPIDVAPLVTHVVQGRHEGRPTGPLLPATTIHPGAVRSGLEHRVAFVVHLHYPELWPELWSTLAPIAPMVAGFVTLTPDAASIGATVRADWPGVTVLDVENRGRDMAPFASLVPVLLDRGVEVALKVHGKRSPQLHHGVQWRRELIGSLLPTPSAATAMAELFAANEDIGIAIPDHFAQPLTLHLRDNLRGLERIGRRVLPPDVVDDWLLDTWTQRTTVFARGSMYWFRPAALAPIGVLGSDDFEPELGQLDGTAAHALERLSAAVAMQQGYEVVAYTFSGSVDRSERGAGAAPGDADRAP